MNERVRDMVRENHVRVDELIYPIFVIEGENICEPVESMPGICQYSIDRLHEELDRVREAGIPAVLLFGIPAHKDEQGSGAYAEDGIVPQAIRYIKKNYKELVVVADVCLCEYTSHGHLCPTVQICVGILWTIPRCRTFGTGISVTGKVIDDRQMEKKNCGKMKQDIKESVDLTTAKPAMAYLDVLKDISIHCNIPIVAYNVSGEYAMVKRARKRLD